jgi:dipeptidyl aminopeptidase/acylaminoacyl peptidase
VNRARSLGIRLFASIVAWLVLCAATGIFATEGALHPARLPLTHADEQRASDIATQNRATLANVEITARDGARLRAWSIRPHMGNGDAVILFHGQGDNRTGMLGPAQMLLRHGFAVLLPDSRAQGMSSGALGTYGVLEADDIRLWFEWLRRQDSPRCIDGLGDSMGGAELLESLAAEKGFCAVVAESPFATFREAAYDRLGQQFSTGPWLGRTLLRPALTAGMEYARLRYGVDLSRADPVDAVARSRVPVLLIHGLADTNLPPRHSEMIRAADPSIALWEPAGAGHCGASTTAPAEYERRVVGWFTAHDSPQIVARLPR